jgi:hypothetical protein
MNTPDATQCPHCKQWNKGLETESGDPGDLPGAIFECDFCKKKFEVTGIRMVAQVFVKPFVPGR